MSTPKGFKIIKFFVGINKNSGLGMYYDTLNDETHYNFKLADDNHTMIPTKILNGKHDYLVFEATELPNMVFNSLKWIKDEFYNMNSVNGDYYPISSVVETTTEKELKVTDKMKKLLGKNKKNQQYFGHFSINDQMCFFSKIEFIY